ncbi:unnamed protein product [Hymenolepis diminuta]|uniref:Uncharacterized protein n=1 Tax=Hymenolepis diminuta TaxID=6216 RepID=A0A0R3S879_HYMDI|nr:unnamed protein product [Hymenolepis diminuta]
MLTANKACIHPVQVVGVADTETQIKGPSPEVAMAEIVHRVVHILHLDHQEEEDQSIGLGQVLQVLVQVQAPAMEETLERSDIQDHPLVIQAQVQDQIPLVLIIHHLLPLHPRHRRPTTIQMVLHLHLATLATTDLNVGPQSTVLELCCQNRELLVLALPVWRLLFEQMLPNASLGYN